MKVAKRRVDVRSCRFPKAVRGKPPNPLVRGGVGFDEG